MTNVSRVWVDTDVALGSGRGDVDDGFAIAALLGAARMRRIELLGISTVSGNASASEAARCARAIAFAAGSDVPVLRGADPRLPDSDAATAAATIAALPAGCRIVSIGPLSNIAAAILLSRDLPGRVSLSVVGGNLTSRGWLPPLWPHEFNLAKDRESARAVLGAPWRELVLYPLDAMRPLRCAAERVRRISRAGPVGALLAEGSRRWLRRSRWRWGRAGFPVWDLPSALQAAGAREVEVVPARFPPAQRRYSGIPENVSAAVAFDPQAAWREFDRLVASF
ncbi:MAG TPA: nucleoside hydrolase [Thermoanaerobaculia bacterium]|nr:nucleoside hydrolase [Thermoanaerobaculia bacterium]